VKRQREKDNSRRRAVQPLGAIAGAMLFAWILARGTWGAPKADTDVAAPTTQPSQVADPAAQIKTWFANLASPDADRRSEAFDNLMGLSPDELPRLRKVVEQTRPLAPAQAAVLREIVTQVFLSGQPYEIEPAGGGFLGIHLAAISDTFSPRGPDDLPVRRGGILVLEAIPGFVGARALRENDIILSIIDRPNVQLLDRVSFALAVTGMGAGAIVHFQVLRQGRIIEVSAKLSHRPAAATEAAMFTDAMDRLILNRSRAVDEYWQKSFAAFFREAVS